jgi:ATP-dependent DNA ligase
MCCAELLESRVDLLELDAKDRKCQAIEACKELHAQPLRGPSEYRAHRALPGDCKIVFRKICQLGSEDILSKRLGSHYRSGQSLKFACREV